MWFFYSLILSSFVCFEKIFGCCIFQSFCICFAFNCCFFLLTFLIKKWLVHDKSIDNALPNHKKNPLMVFPFIIWFCYSFIFFLLVLRCSNIRLEIFFIVCNLLSISNVIDFQSFWNLFPPPWINNYSRNELFSPNHYTCSWDDDDWFILLLLTTAWIFFVLFSIFLSLLLAVFPTKSQLGPTT
jgi:hypothetical protein